MFVRYEQGVLGDYRVGALEREVIASSDVLMAVVYAQIEGFFDSVMEAPSPGLRAVDFGDLGGVTGGVGLVERYVDRFHLGFFGLTPVDVDRIGHLESLARRAGASSWSPSPRREAWPSEATSGSRVRPFRVLEGRRYHRRGRCLRRRLPARVRRVAPGRREPRPRRPERGQAVQRLGAFPWED